ncbi:MAG: IS200/IS605 family transposase [Candidatus Brocadiia bacterium]
MPSSYSKILYHCVFGTKERRAQIHAGVANELYPYMASILPPEKGRVLKVGGTKDHVHLLLELPTNVCIAEAARLLKSNSSRWLNRSGLLVSPFRWQRGFAAFSVSASAEESVRSYLERQEHHHAQRGFREELVALLDRHGVDYDPVYL